MPNYFLKHWFNVFYIAFQRAGSSLIYIDIASNDCHRLKKKKPSPRNNLYNIHLGKVLVNSSGYGFISIVQVDFMTLCTCADFIVISDYTLIF